MPLIAAAGSRPWERTYERRRTHNNTQPARAHQNRSLIAYVPEETGGLLRICQFRPIRIRTGNLHHRDRRLQGEVQHGFRRKLDLLALGRRLNAASNSGTRRRTDRRALAAARDRTNDASKNSSAAHLLRRVLATRLSVFPILIGLQAVGLASGRKTVQLQYDYRLSRKLAGTLHLDKVAREFNARWHRLFPIRTERSIQRRVKRVSSLVLLAVNRIDKTNRQLRPLIDDQFFRCRRSRWGSLNRRCIGGWDLGDLGRSG